MDSRDGNFAERLVKKNSVEIRLSNEMWEKSEWEVWRT